MPFPDEAIDVRVELRLGGTWTDITPHVYTRDPITITGGRTAEGSAPDPSRCTMTLNNKDGRYSPRNPRSPYFGQLGRNTPLRVTVPADHSTVTIPGAGTDQVTAVGSAGLNVTSNLDVAVEMSNAQWARGGTILSKRTAVGDQRSWMLGVDPDNGLALLAWWEDGTAGNNHFNWSTVPPSSAPGRQALRVTVDTAAELTIFYTGPSIDGPWTQLGAQRGPYGGPEPIFASTAPIVLGGEPGYSSTAFAATYHAWRVRDGIDGPLLVDVDLDEVAGSGSSFVDGTGRTWNLTGAADLSDRQTRFAGEVPSWPVRWGPSGQDVHVQIEAAGITRRLGQGAKPVASAVRRSIASAAPHTAWWPLEDSPGSRVAVSGYLNRAGMIPSGEVTFTGSPVGGLGGAVELGDGGALSGPVVSGTSEWVVAWWYDLPKVTGTEDAFTNSVVLHWLCPGSPGGAQWLGYARINPVDGTEQFAVQSTDEGGGATSALVYDGPIWGVGPVQFALHARNTASGILVDLYVNGEHAGAASTFVGDFPTPVAAMGLNNAAIVAASDAEFEAGAISHVLVTSGARREEVTGLVPAGRGYAGETAGTRVVRLAAEENIPLTLTGDPVETVAMGPQLPATILDLLGEAADADGGLLADRRDELALNYRSRASTYDQDPALILDYHDHVAHPLEPVDDDQQVRNDYTVERRGGSSARAVLEDGPLSIQPPPDGVGVYDESVTLNLADDSQLAAQAGWRLHLGTVDEARWPIVRLKLHKHPELIPAATSITERSVIRLTGLPEWLPPEDVDLIVDGYTEVIESLRWTIEFNCVPGSPYRVGVVGGEEYGRVDTDGSVLLADVDADDTTLMVASTDGPYWATDPAEFPFDIVMGGETLTATAAANGLTDPFNRTVSNGLGTAPDGQTWTVFGPAAHYSVNGSAAQIAIPATNVADVAGLVQFCESVDVEATFRTVVAPITGAAVYYYLIGHFNPFTFTWYALVVSMQTDGTVRALIEYKAPGGATSAIAAERIVPGLAVTANAWRRARLRIQNGRIDGKVWADGSPEPADWLISAHHSEYTSGDVGLQMYLPPGNTNALPFNFQVGEVVLHNPQKLTVTRSVNGIAKAHTTGTALRLAQPMTIAL
ncbi:hypothetical protein [Actinomadura sp. 21ATH]|uniref:hypothetical protein n=1 Tax=Actinomadura sp. 21ATH TaxID=1735444 RepID=UPI0035BF032E